MRKEERKEDMEEGEKEREGDVMGYLYTVWQCSAVIGVIKS